MSDSRSLTVDIREDAVADLSAATLVMTLMSVMPGRSIPVQALLSAGELFGLSDRSIRVALTRLGANGKIRSAARGRYGFAEGAESVHREVANWVVSANRAGEWSGNWLAVHTGAVPRTDRPLLRRHEGALRLRGFRELERDLWVRPDNLRGGAETVGDELRALGLAPSSLVFLAAEFGADVQARLAGLWDIEALERSYRLWVEEMTASMGRVPGLPLEQAMFETLSVGRYMIKQVILDPLLPEELLGSGNFKRMLDHAEAYDRLGKTIWREFIARHA